MKYPLKFAVVLTLMLLYSCKLKPNPGWIKDKNGCLGIRNQKLAKTMIDQSDLMGSSETDFMKVFGPPDTTTEDNDIRMLIYYWGSMCEQNKPATGADKCYARFYFKKDRLSSTDFICE